MAGCLPGEVKNTVTGPFAGPTWVLPSGTTHSVTSVAKGEALRRGRRLDVDDPVVGVHVQPVEAAAGRDERPVGSLDGLEARDADAIRDDLCLAVHKDGQVRVDVGDQLLTGLALHAVDR